MNPQKGEAYPQGQGRIDQLEDRLVCNQEAGGSNPPASTILKNCFCLTSFDCQSLQELIPIEIVPSIEVTSADRDQD